jgi:arabinogalactan oligomer/maltooligosaccharide transport system substrate-binding protein
MKKKLISCLFSIMVLSSVLTGCGGKDAEKANTSSNAKETKSSDITLSVWAGEEDREYLAAVTQNFIEENKSEANITIDYSPMVEGDCRSALLGDVLNGPDVYTTTDGDIRSIVAGGAASPVTNPDEIKEANLEAAVNALTINDTLYGYPITADNGYFLYYNKKYFKSSDIKSLDKILKIAAKNKKKFAMNWSSGWYLYAFYGQTGLTVGLNEDGVTNFCDWNSTKNSIKGTDVAKALLKIGKNPGFLNTDDWSEGIKKGDIIACVSGVWDDSAMKKAWGSNYAAAVLPTYTCAGKQIQMSCYFGYKMIGVNPYSENLEWAHKLANYIANEENQKLRFTMRGQGPSNINASQSDEVKKAQAIQAVLAQSEYSELQRLGGNFWTPTTTLGNTLASGSVAEKDLQSLLDKTVKQITASTVE